MIKDEKKNDKFSSNFSQILSNRKSEKVKKESKRDKNKFVKENVLSINITDMLCS